MLPEIKIVTNPTDIDIQKWAEFVSRHSRGSVFQTPEMYEVYCNTPGYQPYVFIAYDKQNKILGLLLSVLITPKNPIIGKIFARSIVYGGPLLDDIKSGRDLVKAYKGAMKGKAIYCQIRNFADTFEIKEIFVESGFNYEDHLNIILDLTEGKECLWKNYSRSRKKGINKAKKNNYEFIASSDLSLIDSFYDLLRISYNRIRLPHPPQSHFNAIVKYLKKNEQFMLFMLKRNGENVLALLALRYNGILYGYYMGMTSDSDIIRTKPADLFFHTVFEWCIDNGVSTFDWMGAGKPKEKYGVREFKIQYGGTIINPGRYINVYNPIIYGLGKYALKVWRRIRRKGI